MKASRIQTIPHFKGIIVCFAHIFGNICREAASIRGRVAADLGGPTIPRPPQPKKKSPCDYSFVYLLLSRTVVVQRKDHNRPSMMLRMVLGHPSRSSPPFPVGVCPTCNGRSKMLRQRCAPTLVIYAMQKGELVCHMFSLNCALLFCSNYSRNTFHTTFMLSKQIQPLSLGLEIQKNSGGSSLFSKGMLIKF